MPGRQTGASATLRKTRSLSRRRVERIGHRGARGLFPENTIGGCCLAAALVDRIELDIGITADDRAVVSHDPALNADLTRGRHGAWLSGTSPLLRSLTLVQLAQFDVGRIRAGSRYDGLFPEQKPVDGGRVPSLAALLAALPRMCFTLEIKTFPHRADWTAAPERMADVVLADVRAAGAARRITVQSFDWRGPRHLRRLNLAEAPSFAWLTSAATIAEAARWWDGPVPADFAGSVPRAVAGEGGAGDTWSPAFEDLTQDQVAEAHELGLRVVPWTVNTPQDMARLTGWGVDGIITDRPDLFPTPDADRDPR